MARQAAIASPSSSGSGSVNSVQRVLRSLIWFGVFAVFMVITLTLAFAARAVDDVLFWVVLFLGGFLSLVLSVTISRTLYVVPEFERVVVLKLGQFAGVKGPGVFWIIPYPPFYQSAAVILDIRVKTRVITAAQTLTADNVPVGVEAVIFWRVENPRRAALEVADYSEAVFQAANSALKDTIGTLELTGLLGEREKVSEHLEQIIDAAAGTFGVDVSSVEITDVHVPSDLIQELSVLAQSRRAAQAKIAEAEAEQAIAQKLQEAAELMGPMALEMYRLNVLERLGREEGSQIVVYGMGSGDPRMGETIAAAVAGASAQRPARSTPASRASGSKGTATR